MRTLSCLKSYPGNLLVNKQVAPSNYRWSLFQSHGSAPAVRITVVQTTGVL